MNYFPFHIGDYTAHTAHLELLEDLAYRRLLDQYYLREGPLPGDVAEIARLIRMRTQCDDIESVLREFFILIDGAWHHARCDEELAAMRMKQAAQEQKNGHEADRMKRHRERRSQVFEALREKGIVPAWDVSSKELQRLLDEASNAPATRTGALPATDPQRLSLPTPTPTPTPVLEKGAIAPLSTTVSPTAGQQADRPVGDDEPAESIPDCPHLRVIELFGRILPALPQPKPELWSGTKATHMRARWAWLLTAKRRSGERYAVNEEDAMDWLRRLFEHVAESDFLMGRTQVNFSCSLEWLVNAANFSKVVQGNYTNKEKP